MKGRVCLVTGGNKGIGKATAIGLARQGASVAIVSRNRQRGEAAVEEIRRATGNQAVQLLLADLSSLDSMRHLADRVKETFPALHVLVNNVGVIMGERTLTPDGLETTFAVNHMSYFVLTRLLRGLLEQSAPSRVVSVSSETHRSARLRLDDLQAKREFDGLVAYANSKLANILFTYELARRFEGTGVTANCLHPGVIRTQLLNDYARQMNPVVRLVRPFMMLLFGTPRKGARTSIYLASSADVENINGKYFKDQKEARSSEESHDLRTAERLWQISSKLL